MPLLVYALESISFLHKYLSKSRDGSVGIALHYGLDDWGSRV
jgi:hypothetical protein